MGLPDVQTEFRKGRGTRDQTDNICWITENSREFQENIFFCFIDYDKAFDGVDHNKLWKILIKRWEYQATLLASCEIYAGQEAAVRTRHGKMEWFQIRKGVHQGCILSPYLINFYAENKSTEGWMKYKLESRLLEEISITSDIQMTPTLWQKVKRN